jgi:hypothetical protein
MDKGKSKLGRKKVKKVGSSTKKHRPLKTKSVESLVSTPVRPRLEESSEESFCEESPYTFLSSQAVIPDKEVYWNYDTPQIRKYRSRMGVGVKTGEDDSSPIHPFVLEKVSTPTLKLHCEPRPRKVSEQDTTSAEAAYNDLVQFASKLKRREINKKDETTSTPVIRPVRLNPVVETVPCSLQNINCDSSIDFSDDDNSLLVRCTQEAEGEPAGLRRQEAEAGSSPPGVPVGLRHQDFKENVINELDLEFESDDSMEFMMSQMDEKELVSHKPEPSKKPTADLKRPLEPLNSNGSESSPSSSRSIKRFKSSDDGISSISSSSSLRRVHSSPVIPVEATRCSLSEIERKKHEAKRKRQLSQQQKRLKI